MSKVLSEMALFHSGLKYWVSIRTLKMQSIPRSWQGLISMVISIRIPNWIHAFFGSREEQEKIKSIEEGYKLLDPSKEETYLNHGYDEGKGLENLTAEEAAAEKVIRTNLLSGIYSTNGNKTLNAELRNIL